MWRNNNKVILVRVRVLIIRRVTINVRLIVVVMMEIILVMVHPSHPPPRGHPINH